MQRKILLLGASNTLGVADTSTGPAKGYKDHLQDILGYRWNVVARGAGGARSSDWLPTATEYVPGPGGACGTAWGEMPYPPGEDTPICVKLFADYAIPNLPADIVVIQSGVGDAIRFLVDQTPPTSKIQYGRNIRDIVNALLAKGANVMVPIDFPSRGNIQTFLDGYEQEIRDLWTLHRENPRFIPGPDLRNELNTDMGTDFGADHFHPNNLGHLHAASLFAQKILAWEATH